MASKKVTRCGQRKDMQWVSCSEEGSQEGTGRAKRQRASKRDHSALFPFSFKSDNIHRLYKVMSKYNKELINTFQLF